MAERPAHSARPAQAAPPAQSGPFIAADLGASGIAGTPKSGYTFEVVGTGPTVATSAQTCNSADADTRYGFFATADPHRVGVTGTRHFAGDHSGQLREGATTLTTITSGVPLQ